MTDEMLALAEDNKRKIGLTNVEFLKGEIENIPLPDNSMDVIISNCVINLSGDKDRVLKEAFRVLKPGGRFAISDVVVRGKVAAEIKKSLELWVGCVAGALSDYDYVAKLAKAGFNNIDIEPTRVYSIEDARAFLAGQGLDVDALAREVEGKFISAFIRANKPAASSAAGQVAAPDKGMTLSRRVVAEALGTAFLLAAVVGSGIMGEKLAGGNVAIALLANTLATGAMLVTLIFTFGPISGAHFNPAVTLANASQGGIGWSDVPAYIVAQVLGAFIGVGAAHLMFGEGLDPALAARPRRWRTAF